MKTVSIKDFAHLPISLSKEVPYLLLFRVDSVSEELIFFKHPRIPQVAPDANADGFKETVKLLESACFYSTISMSDLIDFYPLVVKDISEDFKLIFEGKKPVSLDKVVA